MQLVVFDRRCFRARALRLLPRPCACPEVALPKGPTPVQPYLDAANIVAVAKAEGCDAVRSPRTRGYSPKGQGHGSVERPPRGLRRRRERLPRRLFGSLSRRVFPSVFSASSQRSHHGSSSWRPLRHALPRGFLGASGLRLPVRERGVRGALPQARHQVTGRKGRGAQRVAPPTRYGLSLRVDLNDGLSKQHRPSYFSSCVVRSCATAPCAWGFCRSHCDSHPEALAQFAPPQWWFSGSWARVPIRSTSSGTRRRRRPSLWPPTSPSCTAPRAS